MTQQEQFEADFLAAGLNHGWLEKEGDKYAFPTVGESFSVWLQQAKRHEAEKAELRDIVDSVADHFQIGANARTKSVILANIGNATRRAKCLSEIESRFFSQIKTDDEGEEYLSTNLSWGDSPEEYAEQFAAELRAKESAAGVVAYGQSCCGNPEDCPNEYTKDCIPVTAPPAQAVSVPSVLTVNALKSASRMLRQWAEKYGENEPSWLVPSGHVDTLELIDEALAAAPSPEQPK